MQIGLQNTPVVDFLGGTVSAEASVEGNKSSGFGAILDALVGGDKGQLRAAVSMKAEMGPLTGTGKIELDTAKVKAALEKLKDALSPLAAAFDALLMPDPQQIAQAQQAFAELAQAVNNHAQRYDAASTLPMGMFADQFGALRQAEAAKGPGNLMQLGKLLSRLDVLLGDGTPGATAQKTNGQLAADAAMAAADGDQALSAKENAKLSLNIHQMIGRLEELSEKLPETAQAAIAKLIDKKAGQLPPGSTAPTGTEGDATADPMAKLLAIEDAGSKKALQNGSSSNLISAALETRGQGDAQGQNATAQENKLMADLRYQGQRPGPATALAQAAQMASELDTNETSIDKVLNIQRSEQLQQTQIHIDKTAQQHAPQKQVNLPALAFEVVRQIRNGAQRFEIRLNPPEMGKIDVQLEMEGKNVTARLTVERAETLDFLQRDQRALERALQQAGLNTDKANLQFSLKQDQNGSQGQNAGQQDDEQQANRQGNAGLEPTSNQRITDSPSLVLRGTARPDGLNLWV